MKRTVFDDQLAHRLGGHKGRLHRNSSPRLCLHWQTTSPSSSLQRYETRVGLSSRQYRILTLRFVSQSPPHCRTWWAVSWASYLWAKLSLANSGSPWIKLAFLTHSGFVSGSLCHCHSHSFRLSLTHFGSLWLSPANSGPLQALTGSQGPCSARYVVAA